MRHATAALLALIVSACAPLPALDPEPADAPVILTPRDGSTPTDATPADALPGSDASRPRLPDSPLDTLVIEHDAALPADAVEVADAPPARDALAATDAPAPRDTAPDAPTTCPALQQWRTAAAPDGSVRCVCTPGARTGFGCERQDTDCDGREDALALCGGQCTDTRSDPAHCGGCGVACAVGAVCRFGACVCPAELTACSNGCFAFPSNRERCSYCARYCLGRDRPDCCAAACAVTMNCGG